MLFNERLGPYWLVGVTLVMCGIYLVQSERDANRTTVTTESSEDQASNQHQSVGLDSPARRTTRGQSSKGKSANGVVEQRESLSHRDLTSRPTKRLDKQSTKD